jgi:hypothetical protein
MRSLILHFLGIQYFNSSFGVIKAISSSTIRSVCCRFCRADGWVEPNNGTLGQCAHFTPSAPLFDCSPIGIYLIRSCLYRIIKDNSVINIGAPASPFQNSILSCHRVNIRNDGLALDLASSLRERDQSKYITRSCQFNQLRK